VTWPHQMESPSIVVHLIGTINYNTIKILRNIMQLLNATLFRIATIASLFRESVENAQ